MAKAAMASRISSQMCLTKVKAAGHRNMVSFAEIPSAIMNQRGER